MEEEDQTRNPRTTCVVIGGHSSIGRSLVLRLLQLGNWIVKIADPDASPTPTHQNSLRYDAVSHGRASFFRLDLLDKSQLLQAFDGSSVVFVAETSDASPCDLYKSYMRIVQGAKNVVNACRECKVNRLIYNSSADVVFDGSHHIKRGDESMPYPLKFTDMLTEMKAQAEAIILSANTDSLLTCALRPSNVFGPSDTHLVHAMVNRATSVWGKFVLGSGDNLSDFTFVENVAHAHICAAEALTSQNVSVAGKAFFITNIEPRNYWGFVSRIYEGLGYQRPNIRVPPKIVNSMLPLVRWARNKLESETEVSDLLDSVLFAIESSLFTRTYNCSAAMEHLKYSPVVPVEEGIALTVKSISHLAKKSIPSKEHQFSDFSKAEEFLGYGRVADILLWRDEMETFTCFLVTCGLFHWFILSGRTFISSTAALLLLATFLLIVISVLPINIFQKFPLPVFTISEPTVRNMLDNVAFVWNEGVQIAKTLAQGEDWSLFIKAASILYFLKLISLSPAFLLGAVLVLAFTSFFIYEQYESELDRAYKVVLIVAKSLLTLLVRSLPPCITSFISVNDELGEKQA